MRPGIVRLLVEPHRGDVPVAAGLELRPTVCAFVVPLSAAPVGVPFCQMLHGHVGPTVVKFHENGLLIGVPELFCAPDTVAV